MNTYLPSGVKTFFIDIIILYNHTKQQREITNQDSIGRG